MKKFVEVHSLTIILFIIIAAFYAFAVNTSGDTFYFMSKGREVWEAKSLPDTSNRTYGTYDKSLVLVEWIAGLIYYFAFSAFNLNGLIVVRVIIALSTLFFVFKTLEIFTKNKLVLNTAVLFTSYILATRTNDRPETFSYLFLAIVNYCCLTYLFEKRLPVTCYLLPVTFLLWPNTHPFAIMGVALYSFYAAVVIKEKIIDKESFPNLYRFLACFFLSLILALLQYKRLFAFFHAQKLASYFTEFTSLGSRIMTTNGYDLINQIPIEVYSYLLLLVTYLMLQITFLIKNKSNFKTILPRQVFYILVVLLPIKYYRTIPLVILITIPSFIFLLKNLSTNFDPKIRNVLAKTTFAIFLMLTLGSIPNKEVIGSRENTYVITTVEAGSQKVTPMGVVNRWWVEKLPIGSARYISKYTTAKRLFTDAGWSNYFLWYLPQIETFADAQSYNRTQKDWEEEREIFHGTGNWKELLINLDIDVVVNTQPDAIAFVYTPVYKLENWKLLYVNEIYMLYVRQDKISSFPVGISKIHPELPDNLKYKKEDEKEAVSQLEKLMEFDPKNGFARDQLIQYHIDVEKNLKKAKKLAEESRILLSHDPKYPLHLANIYVKENNCFQALEFKKEAISKSFNHPVYKNIADSVTRQCN